MLIEKISKWQFNKIIKDKNRKQYKLIKEDIEKNFYNQILSTENEREYIAFEKERMENKIKMLQSPFIAIAISLIVMVISIVIPTLGNYLYDKNQSAEVTISVLNILNIKSEVNPSNSNISTGYIVFFSIVAFILFSCMIIVNENSFRVCNIYFNVLEEAEAKLNGGDDIKMTIDNYEEDVTYQSKKTLLEKLWGYVNKNKSISIVVIVLLFIVPTFSTNYYVKSCIKWIFNSGSNALGYLQYCGALIGGLCTLAGVIITLKYTDEKEKRTELKENSLIVYYDLYLGLKDLKLVCKSIKFGTMSSAPNKLFFSNEWIKNVAKLSEHLDNKMIEEIYQLYGDLEMIGKCLYDNINESDKLFIREKFEKIFKKSLKDMKDSENTDLIDINIELNDKYTNILNKLAKIKSM
ncbi:MULTISPECIES: hypothetical protein [unclassified Clostridium]|uniref:hypothetical protein n=1 Tax=unclassified Clostridium TaxID=2614128 RepID=UPI00029821E7|nr:MULTISPECIES: hypothetical protein [unclassified Clostridium]EKQ57054.1 MAG: hypothetical protein A370_01362 [Clostridium sp. Maddingley MBC34-26]